ncbi:MAG: hypothetical protein ACOC4J_01825, partial [Bacteroidota bacterium]
EYAREAKKHLENINKEDEELLYNYFKSLRRSADRFSKRFNLRVEEIENQLIRYVREENDINLVKSFIERFPNSRYHKSAIHIWHYLEFRKVEKKHTINAYRDFIEQFPEAAQVEESRQAIHKIAFQKAQNKNTPKAWQKFIDAYPQAKQVNIARKEIAKAAFQKARTTNTINALEQYMNDYPGSKYVLDAKNILKSLYFEKAQQDNTIEAFNEYVKKYPKGQNFKTIFNLKSKILGQNLQSSHPKLLKKTNWCIGFDNNYGFEEVIGLAQKKNGNYLLISFASKKKRSDSVPYQFWLLELDQERKLVNNRFINYPGVDTIHYMNLNADDDIIMAGTNIPKADSLSGSFFLLKLDADGNKKWQRKVTNMHVSSLDITPQNDFILAGGITDTTRNEKDSLVNKTLFYMIKMNSDGHKMWERNYSQDGMLAGIDVLSDSNIVFGGHHWVASVNDQGYLNWDYFLPEEDTILLLSCNEDHIAVLSKKDSTSSRLSYLNQSGNQIWEQTINDPWQADQLKLRENDIILTFNEPSGKKLLMLDTKGHSLQEIKNIKSWHPLLFSSGNIATTLKRKETNKDIVLFRY